MIWNSKVGFANTFLHFCNVTYGYAIVQVKLAKLKSSFTLGTKLIGIFKDSFLSQIKVLWVPQDRRSWIYSVYIWVASIDERVASDWEWQSVFWNDLQFQTDINIAVLSRRRQGNKNIISPS